MTDIGNPPKRRFLLGVLIGCTAFGLSLLTHDRAAAQPPAQAGSISGRVTGERGASLPAAQVFIEALGKGALTRANGEYVIENVPAGTHTVAVRLIGYRSQTATVTVRAGERAVQDFALAVDPLGLEALVVTATTEPKIKLSSSTAITTLSPEEIEQKEPRSTAELLESVPGFYVESSGGNVNNNLFARGLPADGSYRYVVFMEDGMPAYDPNDLFFIGADNFVRIDENIDHLEAVRGGNSALYGSNAPGGLVNLISKTGGPDAAGSLKVTGATGGLARYDFNVNGPFADDWLFSVGGFYQFDEGIRDPGFPASRGGQIKANVTRLLDNGYVRVYGKYLNDKNIFYLPLPLQQGTLEDGVVKLEPDFVPGFPDDGTLTTPEARFRRIPLPQNNGELTLPLDNGIGQAGGTLTGELFLEFADGWSITSRARVMNLEHQWNAVVPFEIVDASGFAQDFLNKTPGGASAELLFTNQFDASGNKLRFSTPNNLLTVGGLWHVEKPVSNFSTQFEVRKGFPAGRTTHSAVLGVYFGSFTANNRWFFNDILTDVRDQPRFVDLIIRDADGEVIREVTDNGFRGYLPFYVNAEGDGSLVSVYAGDEIQVSERVRIDVGARFEHDDYEQNVENTEKFDLGGPTDADDALTWGNRTFTRRKVDFEEWAASVGINYQLTDQVALYGRGSRGYKMPLIDQYLFSQFPDTAETLWQAEAGVKVSSPVWGLSAVGYWLTLQDFPSQDARVDPETGETVFVTALVGEARTIGAEVEAVVAPYPGLRLSGTGVLQFHEYTDFIEGGQDLSDNWVRRIPRVVLNLGGSYSDPSGFSVGGEWRFYGKRFSNNANTIELPSFGYANARVAYRIPGQRISLSAAVVNLSDGNGLTEGNPRLDEAGAPAGPALARPILPRRWTFAVRYDF